MPMGTKLGYVQSLRGCHYLKRNWFMSNLSSLFSVFYVLCLFFQSGPVYVSSVEFVNPLPMGFWLAMYKVHIQREPHYKNLWQCRLTTPLSLILYSICNKLWFVFVLKVVVLCSYFCSCLPYVIYIFDNIHVHISVRHV